MGAAAEGEDGVEAALNIEKEKDAHYREIIRVLELASS